MVMVAQMVKVLNNVVLQITKDKRTKNLMEKEEAWRWRRKRSIRKGFGATVTTKILLICWVFVIHQTQWYRLNTSVKYALLILNHNSWKWRAQHLVLVNQTSIFIAEENVWISMSQKVVFLFHSHNPFLVSINPQSPNSQHLYLLQIPNFKSLLFLVIVP